MTVVRCFGVSIVTTCLSLGLLTLWLQMGVLEPMTANVLATLAGIGPSYVLNRRYVWHRTGRSSLTREVVPFWTMAISALVLSTVAVDRAARWADGAGLTGTSRTAAIVAANIAAFGSLWVAQFFLLDRVLFAHHTTKDPR